MPSPLNNGVKFIGRCDDLPGTSGPLIWAFDDTRKPLKFEEFKEVVGDKVVAGLNKRYLHSIKDNFTIKYYSGEFDGGPVVCMMHSGYHHFYSVKMVEGQSAGGVMAMTSEKAKQAGIAHYRAGKMLTPYDCREFDEILFAQIRGEKDGAKMYDKLRGEFNQGWTEEHAGQVSVDSLPSELAPSHRKSL
jgi:hypothetical protein